MEKAFDSLEHNFISATLEKFGFEEDFIQWIRILLCNVTNNGFLMEYFNFNRCTRLGEPLSANLFAYSTYTERRTASETAIEFALLSF